MFLMLTGKHMKTALIVGNIRSWSTDGLRIVYWQSTNSQSTNSQYTSSLLKVYWQSFDCLLTVFWWYTDSLLVFYWQSTDNLLAVYRQSTDGILTVRHGKCQKDYTGKVLKAKPKSLLITLYAQRYKIALIMW